MDILYVMGIVLLFILSFIVIVFFLIFSGKATCRRINMRNIIVKASYKQAKYINDILRMSSNDIYITVDRSIISDWVDRRIYLDSDDEKNMVFVNFKESKKQFGVTFVGLKAIVFIKEENQGNREKSYPLLIPLYHSVKILFFILKKLRNQKYANVNKKKEQIDNKIFNIYTESIE